MYFVHIYIFLKKNSKKNSRFPKFSQKKEKNFQKKKKKKKKKILWTRDIGLPIDFFKKKDPFFSFKDFKIL